MVSPIIISEKSRKIDVDIEKDGMLQLIVTIPPQFLNGNEPKEATF